MATPKFHVNKFEDKDNLIRFIEGISPRSASITFTKDAEVWLLKPTSKGGETIGRIVVHNREEAVLEMVDRAYAEATIGR